MTVDPFAAAQVSSTGAPGNTGDEVDPFGQKPSEIKLSDFPKMDDLYGKLLVIEATKLEKVAKSKEFGGKDGETQDRVTADVTVIDLDNPSESKTYSDMYLSQQALVGQVKGLIAKRLPLLGVLRRTRAKNTPEGYNTPDEVDKCIENWIKDGARGAKPQFSWKMTDYTDDQKAKALVWFRSRSN